MQIFSDETLDKYGMKYEEVALEHSGVPGMKWGHRKNGSRVSSGQLKRINRSADRGDRLAKKFGSHDKAFNRIAGASILGGLAIKLGSVGVASLAKSPQAKAGSLILGNLLAATSFTAGIIGLNQISDSEARRDNK